MPGGEALHVRLVDNRVWPGHVRPPVLSPIKGLVHHHAFGDARRRVSHVARQVLTPPPKPITEHRLRPVHAAVDRLSVRIDQQLGRIEPVPQTRRIWPMYAVAIELPRSYSRQEPVPDVVGALRER